MLELERARENLASSEAALADGSNPYAERNAATHRARIARLEAEQTPAPVPAPVEAPVVPVTAPARIAHQPTGSREDRLRRIAKAMNADERALASAIADGTPPDEFALQAIESRDPDAVARRIVNSDRPAPSRGSAEVEGLAERILSA